MVVDLVVLDLVELSAMEALTALRAPVWAAFSITTSIDSKTSGQAAQC